MCNNDQSQLRSFDKINSWFFHALLSIIFFGVPETYLVIRNVGRISFQDAQNYRNVVRYFEDGHHALIINNKGVFVTGESIHRVYDMLEICESTTNVILDAKGLNGFKVMTRDQVNDLDRHYFGINADEDGVETKEEAKLREHDRRGLMRMASKLRIDDSGHCLALSDDEISLSSGKFMARRSFVGKNQSLFLYGHKSGDCYLSSGESCQSELSDFEEE